MNYLNIAFKRKPLVYITRDIERALGIGLDTPGYFIISNFTDFAKQEAKNRKNVLLVKNKKTLDTWELLRHPKTKLFVNSPLIRKGGSAGILIFKNTPRIETICAENNWQLLNPPAELADKVEEKIPQIQWLGPLKKYLPGYKVRKGKDIDFTKKPFMLQFNRSHTGSGTILIKSKKQLDGIKKTFPEREARIAKYVEGPLFTNNNIVSKNKILIGNISYQITGLKPFTDRPFATVGNDWALPRKILSKKQIRQYKKIAFDVGKRLQKDGWRGLFGIDVVIDKTTGKLYLLEINCRQPASAAYESQLQLSVIPTERERVKGSLKQLTTFEAHLLALLGKDLKKYKLIKITGGAQIVQRVTELVPKLNKIRIRGKTGFKIIKYENKKPGADLLRLQTPAGIMAGHNELNRNGARIVDFAHCQRLGNEWNASRGSVIVLKNGKILLMERNKFGRHYFTIPGGAQENREPDIKKTALRELEEETGLKAILSKEKPLIYDYEGRKEFYFFARKAKGKTKLGGIEKKISVKENSYRLAWVDIEKIKKINLLPEEIKKTIIKRLQLKIGH